MLDNLKHTITGQKPKTATKHRQKAAAAYADEDDYLLEKGLHIVKVKGDGRCLFRALVSILPSVPKTSQ